MPATERRRDKTNADKQSDKNIKSAKTRQKRQLSAQPTQTADEKGKVESTRGDHDKSSNNSKDSKEQANAQGLNEEADKENSIEKINVSN